MFTPARPGGPGDRSPRQVADAVAVGVGEALRVDLVDDRVAQPGGAAACRGQVCHGSAALLVLVAPGVSPARVSLTARCDTEVARAAGSLVIPRDLRKDLPRAPTRGAGGEHGIDWDGDLAMEEPSLGAKLGAEFLGTFGLVFGGCGSAVLAASS